MSTTTLNTLTFYTNLANAKASRKAFGYPLSDNNSFSDIRPTGGAATTYKRSWLAAYLSVER